MRLIADTRLWLRYLAGSPGLDSKTKDTLARTDIWVALSVASLWEIAIKNAKGDPRFNADPAMVREALLSTGVPELPVLASHVIALSRLPAHADHRDPFDRLLVSQAIAEDAVLLTADGKLARYGDCVRMAG